ncbi:MAG: hypothetical protein HZY76_03370 [Anaerolineae bacterium]|nr:MAG: hypothetical protein HZY76_03370 [Anaerolineae bacterium]
MAQSQDLRTYALTQFVQFPGLGAGLLPNGQRPIDADLRLGIISTPGGFSAGYLADNLYDALTPGAPLDANLDGLPDRPLPMAENPSRWATARPSPTPWPTTTAAARRRKTCRSPSPRAGAAPDRWQHEPHHQPGQRRGRHLDHRADRCADRHQLRRAVG